MKAVYMQSQYEQGKGKWHYGEKGQSDSILNYLSKGSIGFHFNLNFTSSTSRNESNYLNM